MTKPYDAGPKGRHQTYPVGASRLGRCGQNLIHALTGVATDKRPFGHQHLHPSTLYGKYKATTTLSNDIHFTPCSNILTEHYNY
jgi:hypothetical protein